MNCCDEYGNCRQGRDCPARTAKVGMRYPKQPSCEPQSAWRENLRYFALWLLYGLLGCLLGGAILFLVVN